MSVAAIQGHLTLIQSESAPQTLTLWLPVPPALQRNRNQAAYSQWLLEAEAACLKTLQGIGRHILKGRDKLLLRLALRDAEVTPNASLRVCLDLTPTKDIPF